MPDEEQTPPEDDELELPEEAEFEERRRQRQRVDLPDRASTSPLLRRIVVGGGGEKPKELGGQELGEAGPQPKHQPLRQGTRQSKSSESRQQLEVPPMDLQPPTTSPGPGEHEKAPEKSGRIGALPVSTPDREIDPRDDPSEPVDLLEPSPTFASWEEERPAPAAPAPEVDAGEDSDGRFGLGLHVRRRYDRVVNVGRCHLQSEDASRILGIVRDFAEKSGLPAYSTRTHTGFWRFLVIREGTLTGDRMVNLITNQVSPGSGRSCRFSSRSKP